LIIDPLRVGGLPSGERSGYLSRNPIGCGQQNRIGSADVMRLRYASPGMPEQFGNRRIAET